MSDFEKSPAITFDVPKAKTSAVPNNNLFIIS
jgi:hypothetical protein